jgi:hypothetical protein
MGRTLAANDPQRSPGYEGARTDRNTELLLRDPRRLTDARPARRAPAFTGSVGGG